MNVGYLEPTREMGFDNVDEPELLHERERFRTARSSAEAEPISLRSVRLLNSPRPWTEVMPMIDVYAGADLFPAGTDRQLGLELTQAVLRAEGAATPGPFHLNNTAAYIHRMDLQAVHTAATDRARPVRVQIITPPGALSRDGQKQLVKDATEIVTRISGDPTQAGRTWVLLTEAAEGSWGLAGTAFGRAELAAKAAVAHAGK